MTPTREDVVICAECGGHDVFFKCARCGSEFYNVTQSREASRARYAPEVRALRKEVRALLARAETAERERNAARDSVTVVLDSRTALRARLTALADNLEASQEKLRTEGKDQADPYFMGVCHEIGYVVAELRAEPEKP